MASNDTHDDQSATEIEVAANHGRKRKFIESRTQLKTEIYNEDEHEELTIAEQDPVPEHVSRVLQKAEELLASLGPEFDDKTAILRKPKRSKPSSSKSVSPLTPTERQPTGSVDFATRPQIDDAIGAPTVPAVLEIDTDETRDVTDETIDVTDETRSLRTLRASTSVSHHRSQTVTELMKRQAMVRSPKERSETATEVVAFNTDVNSDQPAVPEQSPLSQQPISPGPHDFSNDLNNDPSNGLEIDSMATLSTEPPVSRSLAPNAFQPRPALESSPKQSTFRLLLNSVKRLFGAGHAPSSPPKQQSMEEPIDEFAYGAGTYTVANRHVANRRLKETATVPLPHSPNSSENDNH